MEGPIQRNNNVFLLNTTRALSAARAATTAVVPAYGDGCQDGPAAVSAGGRSSRDAAGLPATGWTGSDGIEKCMMSYRTESFRRLARKSPVKK